MNTQPIIVTSDNAAAPAPTVATRRRRRFGNRRGGSLVEAVMVLGIFQMLAFGSAEYGYAFYLKHALQAATAVGVRTAILSKSTDAAVQAAIASQMALTNMQNINYTITTSPASVTNCPNGTYVTVTVACTWANGGINVIPVSMGGIPGTKTMSASATMVHE
jgi:Flp pilus assembly protein TadG